MIPALNRSLTHEKSHKPSVVGSHARPPTRPGNAVVIATAFATAAVAAALALLPLDTASAQGLPAPAVDVGAIIEHVDAGSLERDLRHLVSFGTRHSNSALSDPNHGIEAASQWLHRRFGSGQADGEPRAAVSFHEFDATICGVRGRHRNVAATLPGAAHPERRIVVVAHLDSRNAERCDATGPAPGADDNGSGIVALIALADALTTARAEGLWHPRSTVTLLAVTAEEQGLLGSSAWAAQEAAAGRPIEAVLSVDTIGDPTGCANPACPAGEPVLSGPNDVRLYSTGPSTSADRRLGRTVRRQAARHLPSLNVNMIPATDRPGRGGDHIAFQRAGYPAIRLIEPYETGDGSGRNGRQHNAHDVVDHIDFAYLQSVTRALLASVANISQAPRAPSMPRAELLTTDHLRLHWTAVDGHAQVAGYRVAWRTADQQGGPDDGIDYIGEVDAGQSLSVVVAAPPLGAPVHFAVLAYDAEGHESLWSEELRSDALANIVTSTPTPPASSTSPPSATPTVEPSATTDPTATPRWTNDSFRIYLPQGFRYIAM